MFADLRIVVALVAVGMVLVGALLANAIINAPSPGGGASLVHGSTAAMSVAGRPLPRRDVVRLGDTMDSIALRFHISLAALEALNPTRDPNALVAGERLKLR